MLIYFVLFVGVLSIALYDLIVPLPKETRQLLFLFWFSCFFVFKAFRWDTGTDWPQYLVCFNESEWSNIFSYNRALYVDVMMEPGYIFLNVLVKTLFPFYTAFLIITNLFILVTYTKFLNGIFPRYCLQSLTLIIIITDLFPVRQSISVAIFCFAYYQIKNRSFLKYLAIVLLCSMIHFSSFLLIPFYFVLKINPRFSIYLFTYFIIGIISERLFDIIGFLTQLNILPPVVQQLFVVYGDQETGINHMGDNSGSFWPSYIFHFSLFLMMFYCYMKRQDNENEELKKWKQIGLNSYFVTICFICFHSIPGSSSLLRAQSFFWIGYILMMVYSIQVFFSLKKQIIAVVLLLIVCSWKMVNMGAFKPNSLYHNAFVPYKSIMDINEESRFEDYYR